MSTKTIAVDTRVYERLADVKREGESFSKVIDRLLSEVGAAYTGSEILGGLEAFPALPEADAQRFLEVVAENRASETWKSRDLR